MLGIEITEFDVLFFIIGSFSVAQIYFFPTKKVQRLFIQVSHSKNMQTRFNSYCSIL